LKEFEDSLNTAVFTTEFVTKDKKRLPMGLMTLKMEHGNFFCNDNFDNHEEVAMIVSLDEIIKIDKTVLEILGLPLFFCNKTNI
jgi:hypothetical protein